MARMFSTAARVVVFCAGLAVAMQCYWTQHWSRITVVYGAPCLDGAKPESTGLCVARDADVTANLFTHDYDVTTVDGATHHLSERRWAASAMAGFGASPFTWRTPLVLGLGMALMALASSPARTLRRLRKLSLRAV